MFQAATTLKRLPPHRKAPGGPTPAGSSLPRGPLASSNQVDRKKVVAAVVSAALPDTSVVAVIDDTDSAAIMEGDQADARQEGQAGQEGEEGQEGGQEEGQGEGEARDIAALYERHAPAIYAHCRRLLGSAPAGRDALQESFVRVLQHHRVLGPGDQALRYLYRTSTNVCINLLRQRSVRERAAPLIAAQINAAQSNQPVPGDREFVRLLLDQCDETAVAVALMHFIDGMTQVEVAATLGITRRTVYNRIRKIERLAAEMLEPTAPPDSGENPHAALDDGEAVDALAPAPFAR